MARIGYCIHGVWIGNGSGEAINPSQTVEINGKQIELPRPKCHYCESEKEQLQQQKEFQEQYDHNIFIKRLLDALQNNEEVKKIIKQNFSS